LLQHPFIILNLFSPPFPTWKLTYTVVFSSHIINGRVWLKLLQVVSSQTTFTNHHLEDHKASVSPLNHQNNTVSLFSSKTSKDSNLSFLEMMLCFV
jgi:hypothetical protein